MPYVDGFVLAVPVANRDAYRELATRAAGLFRKYGALRVVECWADDVPEGTLTSFTMAVQRKDDEAIVFSWIEWPSRQARDAGMAQAMADPEMQMDPSAMPFDGKRMIFGGFTTFVDA